MIESAIAFGCIIFGIMLICKAIKLHNEYHDNENNKQ